MHLHVAIGIRLLFRLGKKRFRLSLNHLLLCWWNLGLFFLWPRFFRRSIRMMLQTNKGHKVSSQ
uniref:Uncharacterized protein n=1 Tax=Xenopus tropicalis TaxID=8364 RepID=A0A1B8Y1U5_XENTR